MSGSRPALASLSSINNPRLNQARPRLDIDSPDDPDSGGATGQVGNDRAPSGSSASRSAGGTVGANSGRPSGAGGGREAPGAPFSPSSGLPDALKPYGPGASSAQLDAATMALAPRWNPGDDDVMPGDGRKGARRPRLRDRLPW